ncbi:hypothetical protein KY290_002211 [Solanum tuberosum]|uniref:Uncharacterized protein n=1 Tax=Solanum tuberosum TaxID=4113 RepID=A0ABQ7WPE2_SOLTU|nr:hypothetical protein KY285_002093 [Solanum tuberosum]KAH0782613.1 hypothetical protein KY290_002211 [Solanum tuberosum]
MDEHFKLFSPLLSFLQIRNSKVSPISKLKRGDDLTPVTLTQVSGVQQGDGSSHSGEDATCKVNKLKFQKLEARLLETRLRVSLFSVLTTSAQTYSALQS